MTPEELAATIAQAFGALVSSGVVSYEGSLPVQANVERPKNKEHGDYATNLAMQMRKRTGMVPRDLAELLARELKGYQGIAAVDVAGPGFINIKVAAAAQGEIARSIVVAGSSYGANDGMAGRNVNLEFVSANPTGPVTLASARWAAMGDSLARIMQADGAAVTKEYYFNDSGAQIDRFASSLLAASRGEPIPDDGYHGSYIGDLAEQVVGQHPEIPALDDDAAREAFRVHGIEAMFDEVKTTLHDFDVDFDVYFSERSLHESGAVQAAVDRLKAGGLTYEADGAVWLRSTDYGDDKDRVIVRSNGTPTYLCADAAYYLDKRARGFDRVVIILGADHHGYVGRYRALAASFGDDPDVNLEIVIGQMVRLLKDGEPVRMSKRAGAVLTLEDLVEAIGVDGGRYALVRYANDSSIDIDLELWAKHDNENPVHYVRYAHARCASVLRKAEPLGVVVDLPAFDPAVLSHPQEGVLLRALAEFPSVVATSAELREPHRIARYLEDTAAELHRFYDQCRVLPQGDEEPNDLHRARVVVVQAAKTVFARGLDLLGVSAPERM